MKTILSWCFMQSSSHSWNRGNEAAGNKSLPSGTSVYRKCHIPDGFTCEQPPVFGRCSELSLWTLSAGAWKAVSNFTLENEQRSALHSVLRLWLDSLWMRKAFQGMEWWILQRIPARSSSATSVLLPVFLLLRKKWLKRCKVFAATQQKEDTGCTAGNQS